MEFYSFIYISINKLNYTRSISMRKPRQLKKGAKYHVSAKINRNEHIFEPDQIKNLFMIIVKRSKRKYKYSLENFVIMNNHIHFIIKPDENESLLKIMQWILSIFAIYYNKIHKLKGHVWRGRFWSKIIDNIKQFIDTLTLYHIIFLYIQFMMYLYLNIITNYILS